MTGNPQRHELPRFLARRVVKPTEFIENATSAIGNMEGHPMLLAEDLDRADVRAVAITSVTAALPHGDIARIVERHLQCREQFARDQDGYLISAGMNCGLPFPDLTVAATSRAVHIAHAIRTTVLGDHLGHDEAN